MAGVLNVLQQDTRRGQPWQLAGRQRWAAGPPKRGGAAGTVTAAYGGLHLRGGGMVGERVTGVSGEQ